MGDDDGAGRGQPRRIGNYEIVSVVGRGSFATVYLARCELDGQSFALKVLSPERERDLDVRARFISEGRVCASLAHPNVVRAHAVIENGGEVAIVLDHVSGGSLREWLDRTPGTLSASSTRKVALALLSALTHAHSSGVIHRDIKPDNILLRRNDDDSLDPVLADFGIAKLSGDLKRAASRSTVDGSRMGTYVYMAPEQLRGASNVDHRADQYALAIVLIELLTGTVPYDRDDMLDLERTIRRGGYRLPIAVRQADPVFAAAVERAIHVDPKQRWMDCTAFAQALQGGRVTRADPTTPGPTAISDRAAAPVERAVVAANPPPSWPGHQLLVGAGIAVFTLAAVGISWAGWPYRTGAGDAGPPFAAPATPLTDRSIAADAQTAAPEALPRIADPADLSCLGLQAGEYRGKIGTHRVFMNLPTCTGQGEFYAPVRVGDALTDGGMARGRIDGVSVTIVLGVDESAFDGVRLAGNLVPEGVAGDDWQIFRVAGSH